MSQLPAVSLVPAHGRWAFPAGATSLAQFQFVEINSSGELITPASAGIFAVVLDDAPQLSGATLGTGGEYSGGYTVGVPYGVVFQGVQKVITGANLTPGTAVKTDTSGHAVAASSAGDVILGWTLFASNSGDLAPILLDRSLHN
jgi:hypothetical protein